MTISNKQTLEQALIKSEKIPFYIANLGTVSTSYLYNPYHTANIISTRDIPNTALTTPASFSTGGTSYSNGSLNFSHSGYANSYLAGLNFQGGTTVSIEFYDRLWSCSGLGLTATTAQVFNNFPVFDRYNSDYNIVYFIEVYTLMANTSAITATISYTDINNNSGKTTTVTIPINAPKGILIPILTGIVDNNNSKDIIKSIQSVTLSAAGTAGDFGITAMIKLAEISNIVNAPGAPLSSAGRFIRKDWSDMGLSKVNPNTCICPIIKPNTTTTGILSGQLIIARD